MTTPTEKHMEQARELYDQLVNEFFMLSEESGVEKLAALIAERDAAESERIEWVRRGERAEALCDELRIERDEFKEKAVLHDLVNQAAYELPDGYNIELNIERGSAWVDLYDEQGNRVGLPEEGSLPETLLAAIKQCK